MLFSTTHSRSRAFAWALPLTLVFAAPAWAEDPWRIDREEDGIQVKTRAVEGSDFRAFRGTATYDASVDAIMAVLADGDRFKEWFPDTPESKLLERNGNVSLQYSVMDAPWPVSDRDNIFRSVLTEDPETGARTVRITAAPDAYPEQPDRVRVRAANGTWTITPEASGRTKVVFEMHLEPGGGIPAWLANTRVVESPFQALTNLRDAIAKRAQP